MQPKTSTRPSTSKPSPQHETSRLSLSSLTSPAVNKYPKCENKKQHGKQLLNLICLSQGCKGRGPICAICRTSEHATHLVVPMRRFLEQVQGCLERGAGGRKEASGMKTEPITILEEEEHPGEKMMTEEMPKHEQPIPQPPSPQSQADLQIQQILSYKQKMLYTLTLNVNILAQQIRKIEQKILTESEQSIEQLKNSANLQRNLAHILAQLKEEEYSDVGVYRGRVLGLLNMVRYKSSKYRVIVEDQCELVRNGPARVYEEVEKMSDSFVANLDDWITDSLVKLSKIFEYNPNVKKPVIEKEKEEANPNLYRFSTQLKMKSIIISPDHKTARLGEKLPGLALITGPCPKQKKIRLKISNLSNAIMVGIGLKDILKQNHYKLNSSSLGHGTYLISNNMYTYSHHNKVHNMAMKGLSFSTGEQITISLKGDAVTFVKKSDPKSVTLALKKMGEEEWKQMGFCVFLGGVGDKVEVFE